MPWVWGFFCTAMETIKITLSGKVYPVTVEFGLYGNGRIGIYLVDPQIGDRVATATVNMPTEDLKFPHVFIKNYSENQGMLESLQKAGIISEPLGAVRLPFALAYLCRLTPQWEAEAKRQILIKFPGSEELF